MKSRRLNRIAFASGWLACISASCMTAALAGPADYIFTPHVEYGERELDVKLGAATPKPGNPNAQGASIGLGYGAGEHWFTEIYLKQERYAGQPANVAEWENKFQLTETGQYPVDVGLITEIEAPLSRNAAWEIAAGPLLQTEFGRLQLNGNLIFRHAYVRPDETGVQNATNLGYQWQVKYGWRPVLDFGLQGLGGMGKWNNWSYQSSQAHLAGPAVMGKIPLGGRQAIRYNAAWLFGVSRMAPRNTFRAQVEYEF
ncbi:MAG TPA: hypothetical protein VIU46_01810 [Gallionellaceae bacterium]